jgi:DGQHR domain-containing protein
MSNLKTSKNPSKKKKGKKKKKVLTPQEHEQRKQKREVRNFFRRLGFRRVRVGGLEFTFKDRTGELDDCFVFKNIVVLTEFTIGEPHSSHVLPKKVLFDLIHKNQAEFLTFYQSIAQALKDALAEEDSYALDQYRIKILYFSEKPPSEEVENACSDVFFVDGAKFRYFDSLSKTIQRSARFELFKYLKLNFQEVGTQAHSTSAATKVFNGSILPATYSSFPSDFKVVSFYADPGTLLTMAYVLRRDSWRDQEGLYQRVLIRPKIRSMRRYLANQKRVFVNNIIVTLPSTTQLNDPAHPQKNLNPKDLQVVRDVKISVPYSSNVVGLVDGQHRVYCYHEGDDKYESAIAKIRDRQNLLVTGIIFPETYSEDKQRKFEAQLFLEINDTQARARSGLKQSIELILNPFSPIAIAKAVIQGLATKGPLHGLLQTNYFDPPSFVKVTSIVSYGLRPLVKLDGTDSMFHLWNNANKEKLKDANSAGAKEILKAYIDFCVEKINDLLIAAKLANGPEKWILLPGAKNQFLTPTLINGFLVCLRQLIASGKTKSTATYKTKLDGLANFGFKNYKSSHWRMLGDALFAKYFN